MWPLWSSPTIFIFFKSVLTPTAAGESDVSVDTTWAGPQFPHLWMGDCEWRDCPESSVVLHLWPRQLALVCVAPRRPWGKYVAKPWVGETELWRIQTLGNRRGLGKAWFSELEESLCNNNWLGHWEDSSFSSGEFWLLIFIYTVYVWRLMCMMSIDDIHVDFRTIWGSPFSPSTM